MKKGTWLGLLILVTMAMGRPAEAHRASFFGYLMPGNNIYTVAGRYTGNANITRSSEAYIGYLYSRAIYGIAVGCGLWGSLNRGNGESYDGRWFVQANRCYSYSRPF